MYLRARFRNLVEDGHVDHVVNLAIAIAIIGAGIGALAVVTLGRLVDIPALIAFPVGFLAGGGWVWWWSR